jgi:hypothetical protein
MNDQAHFMWYDVGVRRLCGRPDPVLGTPKPGLTTTKRSFARAVKAMPARVHARNTALSLAPRVAAARIALSDPVA